MTMIQLGKISDKKMNILDCSCGSGQQSKLIASLMHQSKLKVYHIHIHIINTILN